MTGMLLLVAILVSFTASAEISILDISAKNNDSEETGNYSRELYSASYLCDIAGYNYQATDNLNEAIKSDLILMANLITETSFSADELTLLSNWIKAGGTLVAPGIRSVSEDSHNIISEIFGIDATLPIKQSNRRYVINWNSNFFNDRELEYIDEENERTTSIGKIKSFSFFPVECDVLATYETGEAALARHKYGEGRTYLAGISWRDVVQMNQLNKDKEASRQYNNGFEPSADVWAFFIRSVYSITTGLGIWKFTVPAGYMQLLIPTHDCDSRTAYDEMHFMSEYEKSIGLSGHYFLTTHYYSDKQNFGHSYLSDFYNVETIPNALRLLEDGHTVGSHSVCHFPDFNKTDNTDIVTQEEYAQRATCLDGKSTGASTWAEIVMSKQILEKDLGNNVKSFRSGHLCVNKDFHSMLEEGGYLFQSCYTAGDLLSEFPFLGRIGNDISREQTTVLTMPLHMSDVYNNKEGEPLNNDTWNTHRAPDEWESAMSKLRGNYASAILLIHPNRDWKMTLQQRLIDRLDLTEVGLYNFEEYGHFWLSRLNCQFTYSYNEQEGIITIFTDTEELKKSRMTFGIDVTEKPVNKVIISNNDATETFTATLKGLSGTRYLAVPDIPESDLSAGSIKDDDSFGSIGEKGFVVNINGKLISTFTSAEALENIMKELPKGIYIIKGISSTKKVII